MIDIYIKKITIALYIILILINSGSCHGLEPRETISALKLIHPLRFDMMAKYIYAQHYNKKTQSSWPRELYKEHIRAFNNFHESSPSQNYLGGFHETGQPKHCFDDFLDAFNQTLESLKNGYDPKKSPIPICIRNDFLIMNGAHRVTSCLLYNHLVPITRLPKKVRPDYYSYSFFWGRGLKRIYSDEIARSYCQLPKNLVVVLCQGASSQNIKTISRMIAPGKIYYARSIKTPTLLTKNIELLIPKSTINSKVNNLPTGLALIIEFPSNLPPETILIKLKKISHAYNLYLSMNSKDRCELANILFHENSRSYYSQTSINLTLNDTLYKQVIANLKDKNLYAEDICIVDTDDAKKNSLFYINHHRLYPFTCTENQAQIIDTIITDPREHRYYRNIKIAYKKNKKGPSHD